MLPTFLGFQAFLCRLEGRVLNQSPHVRNASRPAVRWNFTWPTHLLASRLSAPVARYANSWPCRDRNASIPLLRSSAPSPAFSLVSLQIAMRQAAVAARAPWCFSGSSRASAFESVKCIGQVATTGNV